VSRQPRTDRLERCFPHAVADAGYLVRRSRAVAQRAKETMMRLMRFLTITALAAGWQYGVPAAKAQTETPSQGTSTPSPNIPERKLDAAAAALMRVASLQEEYQQRIADAPQSDKQKVADEARQAVTKAVTDQGLSIEEYSTILQAAKNDPEVRGKILQRLQPSKQ
jgi:hypothetical protein